MTENTPETIPAQNIPEDAPALADFIAELGDTELAEFLHKHADEAPFLLNGQRTVPQNAYQLLQDVIAHNAPGEYELVQEMFRENFFPEVTTAQVVGKAPEIQKGHLIDKERYVAALHKLELHEDEREKTAEDLTMIARANQSINDLRKRHGLDPILVSPDTLHLIDMSSIDSGKSSGALHNFAQMIEMSTWKSRAMRMNTVYHELLHLGSYYAEQADYDKHNDVINHDTYRLGLEVRRRISKDGKNQIYLKNLNEAVTEETARRHTLSISPDDAELGHIARDRQERVDWYLDAHPEHALENGNTRDELIDIEPLPNEKMLPARFAYFPQREIMWEIFDKLHVKNPERFEGKTQEEAREVLFEMLQKAMFTGNILPFGRLFNKTFGHGKFREFGHLQTTEEQQAFIEGL